MYKFVGISYMDFIPDKQTTPICGYRLHFVDYGQELTPDKGFGASCFSSFVTPAVAVNCGLSSPADMAVLALHLEKPVELSFDRKGKLLALRFPEDASYPPETLEKPKKLGA